MMHHHPLPPHHRPVSTFGASSKVLLQGTHSVLSPAVPDGAQVPSLSTHSEVERNFVNFPHLGPLNHVTACSKQQTLRSGASGSTQWTCSTRLNEMYFASGGRGRGMSKATRSPLDPRTLTSLERALRGQPGAPSYGIKMGVSATFCTHSPPFASST
ncbi:hypothetical protein N656DRAFT_375893 [Canariomyces notabilis]|uniref:Uncharacterized protein n=1 Tax=Canariomyces notabilis TaxID=2074819 RepID=A0AAN6T931_9PEZI|nr:hypothetical protein N656DRAFT_375893 [Canariomyces arenarius]